MKHLSLYLLLALGGLTVFSGCNDDDDSGNDALTAAVLQTYAELVYASYEDSYNTAAELKAAVEVFLANPTAAGFQNCKDQWLAARIPYGQTEAYRFYGGPIDDEDGPEGLINAWPMDELFIDYVVGSSAAGLINDPLTYPTITKAVLADLNESISETSVFTGYHAIEFLLWGQDFNPSGPGQRPYTDYVVGGTAANQGRRGQYLLAVTDLLLDQLAEVRDEWSIDGPYRRRFLATEQSVALGYVFTGLGELSKGELSGERMFVAVDSEDQENEHSCFADNTVVDIRMNFLGLKNVYFGNYIRVNGSQVSGESLAALATTRDAQKASDAAAAFELAELKINLIPSPFDQAILNDQAIILEAVTALSDLSDRLTDVGFALGAQL